MNQVLKNQIGEGWYNLLKHFIESSKFKEITDKLKISDFAPLPKNIFRALELTKLEDVKACIIGQDPYHNKVMTISDKKQIPQATGLAFGVPHDTIYTPPSLKNIQLEIEKEYDVLLLNNFDQTLESWAKQGVLLINTALTVEYGKPGTHIELLKEFTNYLLRQLGSQKTGIIYMLWGGHAKGYKKFITEGYNHILESGHPSPLSANKGHWFGNGHFQQVNEILINNNGPGSLIEWFPDCLKAPF